MHQEDNSHSPLPQGSILLVDDHPANLLALEAVLDDLGQDLVRAASGDLALRFLSERDFAVVLLDVQMYGLDGFETARLIREQERSRPTPIIFVTAHESPDFPMAKAYALGAVDYLVKPIVPDILRAKVAVFVELFHLREAERRERRKHLTTQLTCARAMAETETVAEAIPRVLRAVCEGLGWDWSAFWQADTDGQVLRCAELWHPESLPTDLFDRATRSTILQSGQDLAGRVWAEGNSAWVEDIQNDHTTPRLMLAGQDGLRGVFAFTVAATEKPLGVMEFFSCRPLRPPDAELLQILAAIGSQLVQFIHRKRAEQELRRSQKELKDFVENANVGLHWVGVDGTILWANRAELEMLGYAHDEYVGHSITEFHADPATIEDILSRLANKEELHNYEVSLLCKDGSVRHVLLNSSVFWDGERFCHTRCFSRDITERKALEDSLRQRADDLAESARRKDQFLAMLAHELRNPLTPVLNSLQILRLAEANRLVFDEACSMIERQIHHLSRLIDDLLDVSRIERGMVQVRCERLDLAALVRTTAEDRRQTMTQAGLTLAVDVPKEPVLVAADATRLAQVLNNLLDNAVKFRNGGTEVIVRLAVEANRGQAVIDIQDKGIGIPQDLFPRLFDAFSQADRSLQRARGGLGLGLSLVKGLVELHGGTVEATSAGRGQGAAFTIRLPLKKEFPALTEMPSAPVARATEPLRVLIVEDIPDAADSLRILLELLGHEVAVAYDGLQGVKLARAWRPQVVLCDIGLPGLDGYEVAGELRHDVTTASAQLIALTAYGQEADRRRATEAGFDHHLTKPVDPAALQPLLIRSA